jgi:hypothetical protein
LSGDTIYKLGKGILEGRRKEVGRGAGRNREIRADVSMVDLAILSV